MEDNAKTPNSKADKIMNGIAVWCSFYRANPHRFAKDYLDIDLKIFQKILLFMMNFSTHFMYIAARGQGKTFLIAIFCVVRCILYPGTKICIAGKARQQGAEVVEKIASILMPNSANLRLEVSSVVNTATKNEVMFHNGSSLKVVTANDNARHNRSNVIFIDEYRMLDPNIINSVIRKFNTAPRQPKYLNKPEYAHLAERNKEMYASSAYFKSSWAYDKMMAYLKNLVDDTKRYFLCGLPYQLSIRENLLSAEAVADEMSEADFSEISWEMEMCINWYGESESAFFLFDDLARARRLDCPVFPKTHYEKMMHKGFKYREKAAGEVRILAADIAVMGGKVNDATALFVLQLIPGKSGQYMRNVIYADAFEGGHAEVQALKIRRLYEEFECDWITLDTSGAGLGVFDFLVRDLVDPETGEYFAAISCENDEKMHERYQGSDANPDRVIVSVKANSAFNTQCALALRDSLKRGKMRLLVSEVDGREFLDKTYKKSFADISIEDQTQLLMPFIHTSLLITEMLGLEQSGTKNSNDIKLVEKAGARKDRYSALSYGNYFANQLERQLAKKKRGKDASLVFAFRAPTTKTGGTRL